jgi:hypothetical protein
MHFRNFVCLLFLAPTILAADDATIVSIDAPALVVPGETFLASVRMKNTGDTTWTTNAPYVLGSESPRNSNPFGTARMLLSNGPVAPGAEGVFTNVFSAPQIPGVRIFAWRPMADDVAAYFGETAVARIRIGTSAVFSPDGIVVMQVGDGASTIATSGSPMFLAEYSTNGGAPRARVALPTVGTNAFVTGGNQFTGMIDLSSDRRQIVMGGYNTNAPYIASVEAAGSPVPRAAGTVDVEGNFVLQALASSGVTGSGAQFIGGTFRGVVSDGRGNFWAGAQNSGIQYLGTNAPPVKIDGAGAGAIRSMQMVGTNIYFSSSQFPVSTHGIVAFTGSPKTVSGPAMVINMSAAQTAGQLPAGTINLKGFAVKTDAKIAYVVDSRAAVADSAIYRFNGTGTGAPGSWTFAYRLANSSVEGIPQEISADFNGTTPVIYGTAGVGSATVPNKLFKIIDTGADAQLTLMATAETGTMFRGVTFSPLPYGDEAGVSIARGANGIFVAWTGGPLMSATNVQGPFYLEQALSPLRVNPTNAATFFQIRPGSGARFAPSSLQGHSYTLTGENEITIIFAPTGNTFTYNTAAPGGTYTAALNGDTWMVHLEGDGTADLGFTFKTATSGLYNSKSSIQLVPVTGEFHAAP